MSWSTQAAKCCCACWYRIPICPCENDEETWPLYIRCDLVDDFFAAHPELGHLVFSRWDPNASDNTLCYDLIPLDVLKVSAIPPVPIPIILPEIPPEDTWFPPPFDDCVFCCPSPCCPPCWGYPTAAGCCWLPGQLGQATVQYSRTQTNWICCVPHEGTEVIVCEAGSWNADYELVSCNSVGALWLWQSGDDCLWDWWAFTCHVEPPEGGDQGWTNSEDMECARPCFTEGGCIDLLPFACPSEDQGGPGEPIGGFFPWCIPMFSSPGGGGHNPIRLACDGAWWGWKCMYASVLDCPRLSQGDPMWATCAWNTVLFLWQVQEICEFAGGNFPLGICILPQPEPEP